MNFPTIAPLNADSAARAAAHQAQLTKPAGSLGELEALSIQLAGIYGVDHPRPDHKAVIVMAGDHGVARSGVSAYPVEVTPQMVHNILNGGAAINVLARLANARVTVVDVGVAVDLPALPGLVLRKVAYGTRNMLTEPAMTRAEAEAAINVGIEVVTDQVHQGINLIATGDMGIGNTTPSSAITALYSGLPVKDVVGRGTGVDDAGLVRKIQAIESALALHNPDPEDAMDVLCKIGGLEIAGIAGVIIGAAANHVPVVVDGFISTAAALIAARLVPGVQPYMIGAHQSVEIGHQTLLKLLQLRPLLNLNLRLGEGTGAALAFHLIDAAAAILNEMATFASAGVSTRE